MDGPDYPIENFKLALELSNRLKTLSIQLLEYSYIYEAFGSWWFIYKDRTEKLQIVYDGRDDFLTLEKPRPGTQPLEWETIRAVKCPSSKDVDVLESAWSLIETYHGLET